MRVPVAAFTGDPPIVILRPPRDAYVTRDCSICGSSAESTPVTQVACGDATSVETAFCRLCEHVYLRKLPSLDWYRWYYEQAWDRGRPELSAAARAHYRAGTLRMKVRDRVRRGPAPSAFRRDVAGAARSMQIFGMLVGVVEESEAYHADSSLRSVLEIGCGYGKVLELFHRRGFQAFGTEASPQRVAACRERGLKVVESRLEGFGGLERRAPFDLVYSLHVLEHVADPRTHLAAAAALLRERGYFYVQVPYSMHEANVFHRAHSVVHTDSYSPRSLALVLLSAGLVPLRLQVDNSLQIVARKVDAAPASYGPLGSFRETAVPESFLELVRALGEERGALVAEWDHAYVDVCRADTGERVFSRNVHWNVDVLRARSRLVFSLDGSAPTLPIRFEHAGADPPVATKQS